MTKVPKIKGFRYTRLNLPRDQSMIKNFIQAISYLCDYLDSHLGDQFSQLISFAEKVHHHKDRKETDNLNHQLEQFSNLLDNKFFFTKEECDEIKVALEDSLEQFYDKLISLMIDRYAESGFYKEIDDEISKIAIKLQDEPFNFASDGIEKTLNAGFMFNLHIDRSEDEYADKWGYEMEGYFQRHKEESKGSGERDCVAQFAELDQVLYKKFCEKPDTPIYVLRLVHKFPYMSQET